MSKLEVEVEIKTPIDVFYLIFRSQCYKIPNLCSDEVQGIEVISGDWGTLGSVKQWSYTLDGSTYLSLKETIEEADDINKKITFNILEGELLKSYKSFKAIMQGYPKGLGGLVKYTFEFEKLSEDVPSPDAYLDFAVKVTNDIDAHLLGAIPSIV